MNVYPLSQFLAGLEKRHCFFIDGDGRTRARIAPYTCISLFDDKGAEPSQFDSVTACESRADFVENSLHNKFDISPQQMRVSGSQLGYEL
ncbi:hypothetical protein A0U90_04350 [Kozakia baliensis]|nr:hypothetical protein A0U90_04350 [Kozakia baliensis]